ncbi:MAG TPA: glycosyltransferase family 4 protein [Bacteroidales bacterium]|nr:glycosyltransferase family 4 protein [Bacteroidales bacterium]HQJ21492.1 glycosyltransferase family 4 protein [Bacteroidales bacterium]
MKILFISSGRSGHVGSVVRNQGESLKKSGIEVEYFLIKSGFLGYFISIFELRKIIKKNNYDLAHAHYSLCGFVASLAGCKPLIVSLMGSDIYMSKAPGLITKFFYNYKWDAVIVKTQRMKERLNLKGANVIPNGVDISRFKTIPVIDAKKYLNLNVSKKYLLFISSPNRPEKNFQLARKAVELLNRNDIVLLPVYNVPNSEIVYYLNSAEALILTSKYEGSPNVIKEAMACNCPIISTDVGDVRWVIGETEGCFIASFDPYDFAEKIKLALDFSEKGGRTNGRQRIIELGLDSETIAKKILEVYNRLMTNHLLQ